MVHDLTANSDFQGGREFNFLGRFSRELERVSDNLTPPYDEVILTGTTFDRDHKRYILDYESDEKNMCDCCGAPIRITPWDFEENKTLCPNCEKAMLCYGYICPHCGYDNTSICSRLGNL